MQGRKCNWVQFRNICGIQLNLVDLKHYNERKTSLLKGMVSKSGKKFDAFIAMDEERPLFIFPKRRKGNK
jgi:DNA topoisomerase-3